jgi:hypothetical protein
MYPAARFLIFVLILVGLLLLCGAAVSGLMAAGVIEPSKALVDVQHRNNITRELGFTVLAVWCLITGLGVLVACDMVRAVVNTAVNTREMLEIMRQNGRGSWSK